MASIEEAREILDALGLPPAQRNRMSALTLLALCGLTPQLPWSAAARRRCTVTKGVMDYIRDQYDADYAPNTRETFRRQVLHHFVQERVADYNPFDPTLPTNSPHAHYAVSEDALAAIERFGDASWSDAVREFLQRKASLRQAQSSRNFHMVPVTLPSGVHLQLSPGKHNAVQKAVVEEFAPRFAPGARLLYLGDTANKDLAMDTTRLAALGVAVTEHDKLPDILLHDKARNWLFLIEAVTSHGPLSSKRIVELEATLTNCSAGRIYVTAFPDFAEFRKHMNAIAWDTEVWLCDSPDHMIHYNGDRFLGPRQAGHGSPI